MLDIKIAIGTTQGTKSASTRSAHDRTDTRRDGCEPQAPANEGMVMFMNGTS